MNAVAKHRLEFIADGHKYLLDGAKVPGVTDILRAALEFGHASQEVLRAALQRGTAVHKAIELDCKGTLDVSTIDRRVWPYFAQWRMWRGQSAFQPLTVERDGIFGAELRVYSALFGYAGTLDLAGRFPQTPQNEIIVPDIKTGGIPCTVGMQTAGYADALLEMLRLLHPSRAFVVRRYCLNLTPERSKFLPLTSASDREDFRAALRMWRFCNANDLT
jgi:hypothetical protein